VLALELGPALLEAILEASLAIHLPVETKLSAAQMD
jgi:hypothetical protein